MKKILGLDLGTNSIGWALIENDFETKQGKILGLGSRIIPMSQDILGNFDAGNSISQTAERTGYRGTRRLRERNLLRRERLHRVLNVLGFLPEHYANQIDFEKRLGKFLDEKEPKIAWGEDENGKFEFIFQKSFNEMVEDFQANGQDIKIPYDWTIYYLRKKALTQKIEKEELAWIIMNFNQKRGYYQLRGEEEEKTNVKEYVESLNVVSIEKGEIDKKNDKKSWYKMTLENGWEYSATFTTEPNWLNTKKEFLITEEYDDDGNIKVVKDKKTDTTGKEKRRITPLPSFDEIDLMSKEQKDKMYKKIKARTEITISNTGKTVGTYIYETLLEKPNQKIRGKLVRTIERKFYKDELIAILKKQIELQPELFTEDLYNDCIRELYRNNEEHQLVLSKRNCFLHLFVGDIIFYQRPLRSQKSTIGNCTLEYKIHKINKKDEKGNPIKNVFEKDADGKDIEIKEYLKAVPKSNPLYQEFRLWQWLFNLKIYRKDDDADITGQFIAGVVDKENLFDFLNNRKEIEQKALLKYFKLTEKTHRWNYVEDKKYPCNETKTMISSRLEKVENVSANFLTLEIEQKLWHIIYSVTDKNEFEKALKTFALKNDLDEKSFVENFKKFPPFKSEYGSFSEKAIKKLLPLMRLGKYWNFDTIDSNTKERIEKLQTAEFDENIRDRVREKVNKEKLDKNEDYQGLPLWLAQYVVYDRHSEAEDAGKWKMSYDIQNYLYEFRQHSLRNPIVEQIITETLRVVKDIWEHYAIENNVECVEIYDEKKKKNVKSFGKFFDEIHIELGREMKNTAEDRAKITNQVSDNENTNLRIKAMLMEFAEDDFFKTKIEKADGKIEIINPVRPYSQNQQDILKIYEEDVLRKYSEQELKSEKTELKDKEGKEVTIYNIAKKSAPTDKEIQKYRLWLEQKYCSPYTGEMISLSRLFTTDYEIEHVIPQSRYFDDSLSNKVICEAAVNKLKDSCLGLEFIKKHAGEKVECGMGNIVEIFTEEKYKNFVQEHYKNNNAKRKKLLLEEIPDKMINRQLNDTRHISKFVSKLLSNIVREEKDDDGVNSKNLISGNGKITTKLKQSWGLNNVWNGLILPRFERMNELTNSENFTSKNTEGHTIPAIPVELSKGFQKKRIDHRHHAMDALVVACMTQKHVQYLNNENAKSQKFHLQKGLAKTLRKYETIEKTLQEKDENGIWRIKKDANGKQITKQIEVPKEYFMPWDNFVEGKNFIEQVKSELEKIIISFKQNLRVINKATNKYKKIKDGKKVEIKQEGINWAIRKPLHEETVSGIIDLPWVKVGKGEIITATRKALDKSFNKDKIKKITDTGIQKILINYLESKNNDTELAFSPEGIEEMNKNITQYNDGKFHQPIFKVRVYEKGKGRFILGNTGNKKSKYVQGAPNLFFAIYERKDNKERMFDTVPLNEVMEHQKVQAPTNIEKSERTDIPVKNILDYRGKEVEVNYLFHLSPNDLVYVPTEDEQENIRAIDFENLDKEQLKRIYKVEKFSGTECYFVRNDIAFLIKQYDAKTKLGELESQNKLQTTMCKERIKIADVCIKLNIDRLGNIKPKKQ